MFSHIWHNMMWKEWYRSPSQKKNSEMFSILREFSLIFIFFTGYGSFWWGSLFNLHSHRSQSHQWPCALNRIQMSIHFFQTFYIISKNKKKRTYTCTYTDIEWFKSADGTTTIQKSNLQFPLGMRFCRWMHEFQLKSKTRWSS